ncbi:MAG: tetratricopeptide repeat protein [Parvibaculales bacterium]
MENETIFDVDMQGFAQKVLQTSQEKLVLVQFWSDDCAPCKELAPRLEKRVHESEGALALARINVKEQPEIAAQLRVQSVPAVLAFKAGRPVDGFVGAVSDSELDTFLSRLGVDGGNNELQNLLEAGATAKTEQNWEQAFQAYGQALQLDENSLDAIGGLAQCYIQAGELDPAEHLLAQLEEKDKSHEAIKAAYAGLQLAQKGGSSGDIEALKTKCAQNQNDHESRLALALAYHESGQKAEAMTSLLTAIEQDANWQEGAAKKQLLELFDAYGIEDEAVIEARKRLSSLLFR